MPPCGCAGNRAGFGMTAASVITAIRIHLGHPQRIPAEPAAKQSAPPPFVAVDLTRLANLAAALRWEAGQVGAIPQGYPLWAHVIMTVIHKLLPWYTRPIQNFSRTAGEYAQELSYQIGVLANAQAELAGRLERVSSLDSPSE